MASIHVMPRADVVAHQPNDACVCGPQQEYHDGGWVVIHHSLDGREQSEAR